MCPPGEMILWVRKQRKAADSVGAPVAMEAMLVSPKAVAPEVRGRMGRRAEEEREDVSTFEVAIFDPAGNFIPADNDMVLGWQSREDIDKLIQIHS